MSIFQIILKGRKYTARPQLANYKNAFKEVLLLCLRRDYISRYRELPLSIKKYTIDLNEKFTIQAIKNSTLEKPEQTMRSTRKIYAALIAASIALSTGLADAATVTSTLAVSATVNTVCVVNSVGAMAFGAYTGVAVTSSSTLNYTCSNALPVQISFDKGLNGVSTATRVMKNATSTLSYQIYSDSARTTVWDDTTNKIAVTGSGASATATIYGQIPAGQYPTAGAYTDTVTITFTY